MGEAKRRKRQDKNYGTDNFELKFLSDEEIETEVIKELKTLIYRQRTKCYFVQLITKEATITGAGITFLVGTEVNVKCIWQKLDDKSEEFQNRITNRHLKKITRKIALKLKYELEKY